MSLKIYKTFPNTAELHVTGNVQTVLNGYVDNTNLQDDIKPVSHPSKIKLYYKK